MQAKGAVLVIFGATGDLAGRKLFPALLNLSGRNQLPEEFNIIALGRKPHSEHSFRVVVREKLDEHGHGFGNATVEQFLSRIRYVECDITHATAYTTLSTQLSFFGECDRLFYLAVPPLLYENIVEQLSLSKLVSRGHGKKLSRILIEKPFGRDATTAEALDVALGALFLEEHIFRIDHYLAKETLQNILAFRFSNTLFEPVWNAEFIESVHILLSERGAVETRAAFYSDTGALKDVGQNHLLQMLALIAMERPQDLDPEHIRAARATVLKSLIPVTRQDVLTRVSRGRCSSCVLGASGAETYFKVQTSLSIPRWEGVPFILESGKYLQEDRVQICVSFKPGTSCFPILGTCPVGNRLTFTIQPEEGITLTFLAKKPGFTIELEERTLVLSYANKEAQGVSPSAYERIIYDGIRGDTTLFTSTEEVLASWRFISSVLSVWEAVPLVLYTQGARELGYTIVQ